MSIAPYEFVYRGFLLSRVQPELPPQVWWTRVAVSGGYGYLFADNADLADWPSWMQSAAGDGLAEYRDFGGASTARRPCRRPHHDLSVRRLGAGYR